MAWIRTIREGEWDGELGDLYPAVVDASTGRVVSLNPAGMKAHDALYRSAMAGTAGLRKVERELIALVVSTINECDY